MNRALKSVADSDIVNYCYVQAMYRPRLALSQCHVPRHHSVTARSLWLFSVLGTICRHHFVELIRWHFQTPTPNIFLCWVFLVFCFSWILLGALVVLTLILTFWLIDWLIDWLIERSIDRETTGTCVYTVKIAICASAWHQHMSARFVVFYDERMSP